MDTLALTNYVSLKLGEQSVFYPPEEVVTAGLNPAQRLLCLAYPALLRSRVVLTTTTDIPFIDLRTVTDASGLPLGTRIRKVNRVMLGNVTLDTPVPTLTGELTELRRVSLESLRSRGDWMQQRGLVRNYWLWGRMWLGLYKRPIDTATITVVFDALPTPLRLDAPDASPDLQDTYHTVIAEIAAGLLLVKEADPIGVKGLQMVAQALGLTPDKQRQSA